MEDGEPTLPFESPIALDELDQNPPEGPFVDCLPSIDATGEHVIEGVGVATSAPDLLQPAAGVPAKGAPEHAP